MSTRHHVVVWLALFGTAPVLAQIPRAYDGHPNLSGIWKTTSTANWNLEDHGPQAGPYWQIGTLNTIPPGRGVVEGGTIPYKPDALAKRDENRAHRGARTPRRSATCPASRARPTCRIRSPSFREPTAC